MQPWQGPGLIVPHCLMWCLWWERNSMCFEDNERSIPDLMLFFFRTLLDYLVVMWNQSFSSFLDILDSSNFCTVDPLYTSCVLRCSFLISIELITYKKKLGVRAVATPGILFKVFLFHFEKISGHFNLFRVFR